MNYYLLLGCSLVGLALFLQYLSSMYARKYIALLPIIFGIGSYWLGLLSVLLMFVLIFIAQLVPNLIRNEGFDVYEVEAHIH